MMQSKHGKYETAIDKELKLIHRQEESLRRAAVKGKTPQWKTALEEKVPGSIYENLQKAFRKAFAIVFEKGTGLIEKTYNRESLEEDCQVREFAFQVKANRKTLKKARKDARAGNLRNLAITSAEGIGLGVLGIGLPDIVMFVGVLLKGIYETALQYGYAYDSDQERCFILKLMETAVLKGEDWEEGNREIDRYIESSAAECAVEEESGTEESGEEEPGAEESGEEEFEAEGPGEQQQSETWEKDLRERVKEQTGRTADAFAMDMVLLKFIQGLPVVGILGGTGNPLYYNKVIKYAELKYRKRYLLKLREKFRSQQDPGKM